MMYGQWNMIPLEYPGFWEAASAEVFNQSIEHKSRVTKKAQCQDSIKKSHSQTMKWQIPLYT